ncbi:MAG: hypothetical protein Q8K93_20910, partial [Reyranella sp.]|nr:hypothetical protein [Reyranella sp.]
MLLYALRRLLYLVPVAFGVSLLVFALVHLAPGDPISAIVPPDAPKEVVDKLKEYYGFDQPLPVQYFRWLTVTLTGDLGTSIGTGRPVAAEVASAFGNTIILAISATLFAFSLAVILGTAAAYAKSRIVDQAYWVYIAHDLNPRAMSPKVKGFVQAQSWFQDLTTV